jgi:putative phosphoesterase
MKLGVISDTHNYLDPRVSEIFSGVDHILHAGDVGQSLLIAELEAIAPVTAVVGNTDEGLPLRETEVVTLGGKKFLVHHIVTPGVPSSRIAAKLRTEQPDVVLFGHTHKPFVEQIENILFFNPGSAGQKRFDLPRTVALMEIENGKLNYRFVSLE